MIKNIIASGIGFNPGGVSFIVTRGFDIGAVVSPPFRGGGGGGRYRHWTPDVEPKRKFTKKDEKELKKLILKAEENHSALLRKAESLQGVSGAISGVREAVNSVAKDVREMARAEEISKKKAKELLEEIYEEEEILLSILRAL